MYYFIPESIWLAKKQGPIGLLLCASTFEGCKSCPMQASIPPRHASTGEVTIGGCERNAAGC